MEIWDLYNDRRELTGLRHIRGERIPQGYYHLVVHVWLRSSCGKYLISQRSADRTSFPLMWECTGGSVLKGEDSLSGAVREVWEELGIRLPEESGQLLFSKVRDTIRGERFGDILDVWLFTYDGNPCLEAAPTKEVAQAVWMDPSEVQKLYESGKFVSTLDYFFHTDELGTHETAAF